MYNVANVVNLLKNVFLSIYILVDAGLVKNIGVRNFKKI